jgi:hypothetical protein
MAEVTKEQVRGAVDTVLVLAEAVRELGEVPSGELYAVAMSAGLSLESYQKVLGILKRANLVEETPGHLLRWVGPKIPR